MLYRALTDFVVGVDEHELDKNGNVVRNDDGNPILKKDFDELPVLIHGGDVVDDRDKKYAPIVKRFAHNFVPAE
jgi:hypothetical protein